MARKLTDEEIARITAKPKGEFRPTNMAKAIIARVQAGTNPLIDEESQKEARNWFLLGHCEVGGKITPPPPFPREM